MPIYPSKKRCIPLASLAKHDILRRAFSNEREIKSSFEGSKGLPGSLRSGVFVAIVKLHNVWTNGYRVNNRDVVWKDYEAKFPYLLVRQNTKASQLFFTAQCAKFAKRLSFISLRSQRSLQLNSRKLGMRYRSKNEYRLFAI